MVGDLLDDDGLIDLRPRPVSTTPSPGPPPRSVAVAQGPCAVCGARPARALCAACGRGACGADLWALLGVCKDCARGET